MKFLLTDEKVLINTRYIQAIKVIPISKQADDEEEKYNILAITEAGDHVLKYKVNQAQARLYLKNQGFIE